MRTILVPTDFSETAEHALDFAVKLAAQFDARIHLLDVITLPSIATMEVGLTLAQPMIEAMLAGAQKALSEAALARQGKAMFAPVRYEIGDARTVIVDVAQTIGADMIVMGTHGRRGVSRFLLGSVAEAVVRTAPCPVLVVRTS